MFTGEAYIPNYVNAVENRDIGSYNNIASDANSLSAVVYVFCMQQLVESMQCNNDIWTWGFHAFMARLCNTASESDSYQLLTFEAEDQLRRPGSRSKS